MHRQQGKAYAVKRTRRTLLSYMEKNVWIAVGAGGAVQYVHVVRLAVQYVWTCSTVVWYVRP